MIESGELIQEWELGVKEQLKRAEVHKYFERVTTLRELFLSLKHLDPEEFSEGWKDLPPDSEFEFRIPCMFHPLLSQALCTTCEWVKFRVYSNVVEPPFEVVESSFQLAMTRGSDGNYPSYSNIINSRRFDTWAMKPHSWLKQPPCSDLRRRRPMRKCHRVVASWCGYPDEFVVDADEGFINAMVASNMLL